MLQPSLTDIPPALLAETLVETINSLVDAEVALSTIYEQEREYGEGKVLVTEPLGDARLPTEVEGLPGKRVHHLAAAVGFGYTHPDFGQRALLHLYAVRDNPFYGGIFEHYQGLLAQLLTSNKLRAAAHEPQTDLLIARPSKIPVREQKFPYTASWDPDTNIELLLLQPTPEAIAEVQEREAHNLLEDTYSRFNIQPNPPLKPFHQSGEFITPDATMQARARLNQVSLEKAGALLEKTGLFETRSAELAYRDLASVVQALERPYERALRSLVLISNGLRHAA